jgi:hypothetical protein
VDIFFEELDCEFDDNICLSFVETCPDEEKVFIHDETNLFLTPDQAEKFAGELLNAAKKSRQARLEKCGS